jgi:mxaJ protein
MVAFATLAVSAAAPVAPSNVRTHAHTGAPRTTAPLRICADPANLPFTDINGRGFENRIADMLARDLGTAVQYTWRPQRTDFIDTTLLANRCDIVMGYPSNVQMLATTKPYYRSIFVFVTRRSSGLHVRSYDDPALTKLRIGVQFSGEDDASSPPAKSLGRRGIAGNLVGFLAFGDEHATNRPAEIITAVARGDIDIAAAWGPMAGYFAAREREPLDVTLVSPQSDGPLPQAFDISMAVRRGEPVRLARLNRFIDTHRGDIDALLAEYHVPRVDRVTP